VHDASIQIRDEGREAKAGGPCSLCSLCDFRHFQNDSTQVPGRERSNDVVYSQHCEMIHQMSIQYYGETPGFLMKITGPNELILPPSTSNHSMGHVDARLRFADPGYFPDGMARSFSVVAAAASRTKELAWLEGIWKTSYSFCGHSELPTPSYCVEQLVFYDLSASKFFEKPVEHFETYFRSSPRGKTPRKSLY
jgi:hypothetical protein